MNNPCINETDQRFSFPSKTNKFANYIIKIFSANKIEKIYIMIQIKTKPRKIVTKYPILHFKVNDEIQDFIL